MGAPPVAKAAIGGAAAGASFGPVGAAIGAALAVGLAVFQNSDNALISARDKMLKKWESTGSGFKALPIKKGNPGWWKKYSLNHDDIKNRKVFGNYDKEWERLAKLGGEMLVVTYPEKFEQVIAVYVKNLENGLKVDHAFAAAVEYGGKSTQSAKDIQAVYTAQEIISAPPADLTASQLVTASARATAGVPGVSSVSPGGGCAAPAAAIFLFAISIIKIFSIWVVS